MGEQVKESEQAQCHICGEGEGIGKLRMVTTISSLRPFPYKAAHCDSEQMKPVNKTNVQPQSIYYAIFFLKLIKIFKYYV